MKAFMLAGVSSGIGKTTISMALMSAFNNVSPFKVGPDYIDPGFHEFITGNKSYNLDIFMMGEQGVKYSFYKHHKNISIVEGVMGLYDGIDNSLDNNSSAHIARFLGIPVILVLDGIGKSTSIAAQVLGYKMLDPRVNIAGVIINKVSSAKTYAILKEAIENYTGVKCLGFIGKNDKLNISSRHLGLLQANEVEDLREKLSILRNLVLENIDLKEIEKIASVQTRIFNENKTEIEPPLYISYLKDRYAGKIIAIAQDRAFSFYYNDNIEFLEYMGFKVRYFSPIKDSKVPECDIIYLGGGYPENFAEELSNNKEMINSIKENYEQEKNILAECGGFMYLSNGIEQTDGKIFKMCGLVPCVVNMTNKLDISRFGYITINNKDDIEVAKGHEFHYSKLKAVLEDTRKFKALKKDGRTWECIFNEKNLYAGYPHIHFFGSYKFIEEVF
ncbi:cobyrinate a,c-diamide synthase [Fusobacterium vincentii]|uniref:cobyrinate a,c-diamide synthase n=1 Tax=Fusobacterium vincentii TaxID=155615 RepID=UPI00324A8BA6